MRRLHEREGVFYHGSPVRIEKFDYKYTNTGADEFGAGFYFTSNIKTAQGYGKFIHIAELDINNPIEVDPNTQQSTRGLDSTPGMVRQLVTGAPNYKDKLMDYGDVDYEGEAAVLDMVVDVYSDQDMIRGILYNLASEFYDDEIELFNTNFVKATGFDGVEVNFGSQGSHMIAFFPSQINVIDIQEV